MSRTPSNPLRRTPTSTPTGTSPALLAARALGAVEVAAGVATVLRARDVATDAWWFLDRRLMVGVVTVLGLRQTAQGVVTLARPEPVTLTAGAVVDVLHGASLLPVLVRPGPYRSAARWSAGAALATAVAATAAGSLARAAGRP